MTSLLKIFTNKQLFKGCLKQSFDITTVRSKTRIPNISKKRHPEWLPKPQHALHNEHLTVDNQKFLQEIVESKYGTSVNRVECRTSPLKIEPIEPVMEWKKQSRRTGLIVKKIGIYPLWLKNGKKVSSTLLQVVDNQVIKYIPPENFNPVKRTKHMQVKRKLGCLIIGAESINPQLLTKEYFGLFKDTGVMPKRVLMRFLVSADAALQPGTPLYAAHFKAGDIIDVRAKTIDRGFQGVMKRWGFKGMPASHGVTKTHRRPGNIGSGGIKARVMPGTKLPGHMGNRWRVHRGLKILRVNTKYNVIWVMGHNIPGETNSYCYIYDTILPLKKLNTAPYFPTYLPAVHKEPLPEELYADNVHSFKNPTIEFNE